MWPLVFGRDKTRDRETESQVKMKRREVKMGGTRGAF